MNTGHGMIHWFTDWLYNLAAFLLLLRLPHTTETTRNIISTYNNYIIVSDNVCAHFLNALLHWLPDCLPMTKVRSLSQHKYYPHHYYYHPYLAWVCIGSCILLFVTHRLLSSLLLLLRSRARQYWNTAGTTTTTTTNWTKRRPASTHHSSTDRVAIVLCTNHPQ